MTKDWPRVKTWSWWTQDSRSVIHPEPLRVTPAPGAQQLWGDLGEWRVSKAQPAMDHHPGTLTTPAHDVQQLWGDLGEWRARSSSCSGSPPWHTHQPHELPSTSWSGFWQAAACFSRLIGMGLPGNQAPVSNRDVYLALHT